MTGSNEASREAILRTLYGERLPLAVRYAELLGTTAVTRGLIGPREVDRIWDRHILNSAAVSLVIGEGVSVVDVGSGAGLPGIPLAILRPDLSVTLLEPLLRRTTFLSEVVAEIGLGDQVSVVRGRAEDCAGDHGMRFDVVTSRAVAPLDRLVGWCTPLLAPGGEIVALKGQSAQDEVDTHRARLADAGLVATVQVVRLAPELDTATVLRARFT